MQHIYKRTPMLKCKVQSNFIEITLWHGCSPINLLHISRTPFPKNTSGGLLFFSPTLIFQTCIGDGIIVKLHLHCVRCCCRSKIFKNREKQLPHISIKVLVGNYFIFTTNILLPIIRIKNTGNIMHDTEK